MLILRQVADDFQDFDGDGRIGPRGGDKDFESHFDVLVGREAEEVRAGIGEVLGPIAKEVGGRSAGVVVGAGGNFLEQIRVDPAALLVEPEGFGQVMFVAELAHVMLVVRVGQLMLMIGVG